MHSAPGELGVTPLVEVTRGGLVESSHGGALAVVDSEGGLQATLGRLEPLRRPSITNHRSQVVGEIRPVFSLARYDPPQTLAEALC